MIDEQTGEMIIEPRNELFAALAAAQGEFKPVTTDKKVDFPISGNRRVSYNYASFAAIMEMAQKPLSKNGLSVLQYTRDGMLITTLAHSSGQSISSSLPLPQGGDIKQLGANLSYLRRYQYTSIIGAVVRDEDDDQAVDGEAGKQKRKPDKATNGKTRNTLKPDALQKALSQKVAKNPMLDSETQESLPANYHPSGANTPNLVSKKFQEAVGSEDDYRTCLSYLFGVESASDLTAAQADALLDWMLNGNRGKGFDAELVAPAADEAKLLLEEAKKALKP